ncbi:hypothetical protein VNO77_34807 [Canavalia gladiata]|uniref:Uncharacterized protein n=1 Tax=Canavalia gladiata TaxID=3824 RepID=A0AAN9KEN1_CANGL
MIDPFKSKPADDTRVHRIRSQNPNLCRHHTSHKRKIKAYLSVPFRAFFLLSSPHQHHRSFRLKPFFQGYKPKQ